MATEHQGLVAHHVFCAGAATEHAVLLRRHIMGYSQNIVATYFCGHEHIFSMMQPRLGNAPHRIPLTRCWWVPAVRRSTPIDGRDGEPCDRPQLRLGHCERPPERQGRHQRSCIRVRFRPDPVGQVDQHGPFIVIKEK